MIIKLDKRPFNTFSLEGKPIFSQSTTSIPSEVKSYLNSRFETRFWCRVLTTPKPTDLPTNTKDNVEAIHIEQTVWIKIDFVITTHQIKLYGIPRADGKQQEQCHFITLPLSHLKSVSNVSSEAKASEGQALPLFTLQLHFVESNANMDQQEIIPSGKKKSVLRDGSLMQCKNENDSIQHIEVSGENVTDSPITINTHRSQSDGQISDITSSLFREFLHFKRLFLKEWEKLHLGSTVIIEFGDITPTALDSCNRSLNKLITQRNEQKVDKLCKETREVIETSELNSKVGSNSQKSISALVEDVHIMSEESSVSKKFSLVDTSHLLNQETKFAFVQSGCLIDTGSEKESEMVPTSFNPFDDPPDSVENISINAIVGWGALPGPANLLVDEAKQKKICQIASCDQNILYLSGHAFFFNILIFFHSI